MKSNAKRIVYIVLAIAVVACLLLAIDYLSDGAFGQVENGDSDVEVDVVKDPTTDMTMSEKLLFGLQTAGVGMATVFLVLIILWGVIAFIPKILPEASTASAVASKKADSSVPAVNDQSADEEELVAVCTAAIAALRGNSDCAFKVISITEIN